MIICSSFVVSFFLLKKGPLYAREAWNKSKDMIKPEYMWIIRTGLKLFLIGNTLVKVLMNVEMLYYLTYVTLAFMANFIHPFFFAFHLSEVVIRYPLLRNIIRSFWEPKLALMLTFILIILLNYFFTLFSYIVLYDIYSEDKCNALLTCFIVTFDYAFKNNGGIGGWFDGQIP
jgi:inositol 1,4,5-triphosphate receptor type 1/inositol 1,4,5-triphosphate receptor type 3